MKWITCENADRALSLVCTTAPEARTSDSPACKMATQKIRTWH